MNMNVSRHIQNRYGLSRYQVALVKFLFMTLFSELSKMVIMGILFHKYLPLYLFTLVIMLCLRCTTGGLHFYTYWGCLLMSILFVGLTLVLTIHIETNPLFQITVLLICFIFCNLMEPVTSKYRPEEVKKNFKRNRDFACKFVFSYTIILYIIPANRFLTTGFWVITLHSLQLLIATLKQKGALR